MNTTCIFLKLCNLVSIHFLLVVATAVLFSIDTVNRLISKHWLLNKKIVKQLFFQKKDNRNFDRKFNRDKWKNLVAGLQSESGQYW